mmetsp:Transcript_35688/g.41346  ORF Transcript_35688/g.41346 Transcript_35688/m.41346 type:complete len:249 (+) Transcript_35688:339-1085(+)
MSLEVFVGVVDEELFESVRIEMLKAVDIQNANEPSGCRLGIFTPPAILEANGGIDLPHQPQKYRTVKQFRQRVTLIPCLCQILRFQYSLAPHHQLPRHNRLPHPFLLQPQQLTRGVQRRTLTVQNRNGRSFRGPLIVQFHISEVQHRGNRIPQGLYIPLPQSDQLQTRECFLKIRAIVFVQRWLTLLEESEFHFRREESGGEELVENVVVPFPVGLGGDAGFFEEVVRYCGAHDCSSRELDLYIFSKP